MLIKAADDKQPQIDALNALLARPDVDARTRSRIEQEIRTVRAGERAELDAAYEIEFYARDRQNWMTIHDLRLEVDGRVAQIDHLLVNRLLQVWVCESKHFAEGVSINDHGEWHRYWQGRKLGMASPVEQNRKHITVLEHVFAKGMVRLPRRLGITLKPHLASLILVSNDARITRPRRTADVDGIDTVIKAEQLGATIDRQVESGGVRQLARVIGRDNLESLARELAALHCRVSIDWPAKFGLSAVAPNVPHRVVTTGSQASSQGRGVTCASCGRRVSRGVARYCADDGVRFGGSILCMECQGVRPTSSAMGQRP